MRDPNAFTPEKNEFDDIARAVSTEEDKQHACSLILGLNAKYIRHKCRFANPEAGLAAAINRYKAPPPLVKLPKSSSRDARQDPPPGLNSTKQADFNTQLSVNTLVEMKEFNKQYAL